MDTNLSNISLSAMKIFVAIYETRGVGPAARCLGMSQPGVSTALARLRRMLNNELFVSAGGGMQPTQRAKDIFPSIKSVVSCIEKDILSTQMFDPATDQREFRIALTDVGEAIYAPLALNALTKIAPAVSLRSVSVPASELQEAMTEGEVDLAAGYFPDILSSGFIRKRVGLHSFACIAGRNHELRLQPMTLERYLTARHVVVEAQGRSQEVFEQFLARHRLQRPIGLRTPHFMSLPMIVSQTNLIATVPQALADFFSSSPEVIQLRLPFAPPTFQANLYWSKRVHQDAGNTWLRTRLAEAFRAVAARDYARNGTADHPGGDLSSFRG